MLGLLIIVFAVVLLAGVAATASARRRRALEEERLQAAAERARQTGDADDGTIGSPFGMFPFGGLFEQLLGGPGAWSKSYVFDAETGRWVDISDQQPEAPEEPASQKRTGPHSARRSHEPGSASHGRR